MIIKAILISYGIFTFIISIYSVNWKNNLFPTFLRFFIIYLLFLLIPGWDILLGYFYMKQLNKSESSESVSQNILVNGYFIKNKIFLDGEKYETGCGIGCSFKLMKYNFIEMEVTAPYKDSLAKNIGYYRFSRVKNGDSRCALYYEDIARKTPNHIKMNNYCIASEKITKDTLISQYSYETYMFSQMKDSIFDIKMSKTVIRKIETNEVIAQLKTYHFRPWVYNLDATTYIFPGLFDTLFDKYSLYDTFSMHDEFPNKILKPNNILNGK